MKVKFKVAEKETRTSNVFCCWTQTKGDFDKSLKAITGRVDRVRLVTKIFTLRALKAIIKRARKYKVPSSDAKTTYRALILEEEKTGKMDDRAALVKGGLKRENVPYLDLTIILVSWLLQILAPPPSPLFHNAGHYSEETNKESWTRVGRTLGSFLKKVWCFRAVCYPSLLFYFVPLWRTTFFLFRTDWFFGISVTSVEFYVIVYDYLKNNSNELKNKIQILKIRPVSFRPSCYKQIITLKYMLVRQKKLVFFFFYLNSKWLLSIIIYSFFLFFEFNYVNIVFWKIS